MEMVCNFINVFDGIAITFLLIKQLSEPWNLIYLRLSYTIATDAEVEGSAIWSPDGSSIAYAKDLDGYAKYSLGIFQDPMPSQVHS